MQSTVESQQSTRHPFRFGIQLRHAATGNEWRELARKAEGSGYSTLFLPDHFGEEWSPTVPLTVAAEVTTTLKVGALVYDNDYRHPVVLARDVATMDVMFPGRVEFGLGAGWMTTDYEQSGIKLDTPKVRIQRMGEALEVMKALWSEESVTYTGEHYNLAGARCFPRPVTPGGPKLIVGGGGPKVLAMAAKHADIIGVNPELTSGVGGIEAAKTAVADRYLERIEWIKAAAGDRFADIELQVLGQMEQITPDRQTYAEQIAPLFGLTPEAALQMPIVLVGTVDQICDDLIERRETFGFSYIVVHDMDAFAPVVARLSGK
jgi:probable F420-dependent oxidoreductase